LIKGKVTSIKEFGAYVEIEPGIEGLVHISALSPRRVEQPTEVVQVGDEIQTVIINVEPAKHRIGLSIKDVSHNQSSPSRTKTSAPCDDDPSEFGRILNEGLKKRGSEPDKPRKR
jgi:ribosomal protein S1